VKIVCACLCFRWLIYVERIIVRTCVEQSRIGKGHPRAGSLSKEFWMAFRIESGSAAGSRQVVTQLRSLAISTRIAEATFVAGNRLGMVVIAVVTGSRFPFTVRKMAPPRTVRSVTSGHRLRSHRTAECIRGSLIPPCAPATLFPSAQAEVCNAHAAVCSVLWYDDCN